MLASLIVAFRETMEAGLIIGVVLAATQGVPGRGLVVTLGVLAGLAGAAVLAGFAGTVADALAGTGQELLNATVLLLAVAMLGWHSVWMARHGRAMAAELRGVGAAVRAGDRDIGTLGVVVALAVLREGAEVVLFFAGIVAGGESGAAAMLGGGLAGVAMGAGLSVLTHAGLVRLPPRLLFGAIFWLIALLAAGMAAQAVGFLQSAGTVGVLAGTAWDSSALLSDASLAGRVLHTLVGYSDRPSWLQLVAQAGTLAVIVLAARLASPARGPLPRPAVAQH